jgi:hypothetical protein
MTNYSKTHHNFAENTCNLEVLDNPEKYLGPNYASVLNFWWYLETLTSEQLKKFEIKYRNGQHDERYMTLRNYSENVCGYSNTINSSRASRTHVREIIGMFPCIPAPVTLELIALQTILDRGEELIFVPMISF